MDLSKYQLSERAMTNRFVGPTLRGLNFLGLIVASHQSQRNFAKGFLSLIFVITYTLGLVSLLKTINKFAFRIESVKYCSTSPPKNDDERHHRCQFNV